MDRPKIAIPLPTSFDREYNSRSGPQYAAAVEQAGGEAVMLTLDLAPHETANLINGCQAVLLPGSGADVNPQKYGHLAIEASAPADPAREAVDELLIRDAHDLLKPILGICFGHQSLNVWRGGTLVQDLMVMPVNHAAGKAVAVAHTAMVARESVLGGLLTEGEAPLDGEFLRLPVNSSHHQAIGIAGDGLQVVARCPLDGVIEAVEGRSPDGERHFVVGVQWHPERSYEISEASRALFGLFVHEAQTWRPRLVETSVASSRQGGASYR